MSEFIVTPIFTHDEKNLTRYQELCETFDLAYDDSLELLLGLFDRQRNLLAAGGVKGNIIRGLVSSDEYQGQGLMAQIVTELLNHQASRGLFRNFLYGKKIYERVYQDLGFYTLAEAADLMVFMENSKTAFPDYLQGLKDKSKRYIVSQDSGSAGIVMNANPFTLGHLALVERALANKDILHIFVLEEDASFFSFEERWAMVNRGTAHLPGVITHKSSSYIISQASFPSYFLKSLDAAAIVQAEIDAKIFVKIAKSLNIEERYLGTEPLSDLTRAYNQVLERVLSEAGLAVHIMERSTNEAGQIYSGTLVRSLLAKGKLNEALELVPDTSKAYLINKVQHI